MMKRIGLIVFCMFSMSLINGQLDPTMIIDKIYKELRHGGFEKPKLEIYDGKKYVAAFYPNKNLIRIDSHLLKLCQEISDSEAALAFILAHELSHAFQEHHLTHETDVEFNFVSYIRNVKTTKDKERTCDRLGCFAAMLAGYQSNKVAEEILEKIYDSYGLKDKQMWSYPSLSERQKLSSDVIEEVEDMYEQFTIGNYLSLGGWYYEAGVLFENLKSKFDSDEILQAMSSNYLLEALQYNNGEASNYFFPVEVNFETRLSQILEDQGGKALDKNDYFTRLQLVTKAENVLNELLSRNANHIEASINLISLYLIDYRYDGALKLINQQKLKKLDESEKSRLHLLEGICHGLQGANEKSKEIFANLEKSELEFISNIASANLDQKTSANDKLITSEIKSFKTEKLIIKRKLRGTESTELTDKNNEPLATIKSAKINDKHLVQLNFGTTELLLDITNHDPIEDCNFNIRSTGAIIVNGKYVCVEDFADKKSIYANSKLINVFF